MTITERQQGDVTILDLAGKLTLDHEVAEFRDTIRTLLEQGKKQILLNLDRVPYMDAAGVDELVRSWRTVNEHGGILKIVNLTKRIGPGLLVIPKLLTVFEAFDDEQKALASFRQDRS